MIILLLVISYLLGGIPYGFLVAKAVKRIDIRTKGSGNIGATNVTRVVGKKWGILVFVLDFLKGFVVPFIVPYFIKEPQAIIFILAVIAVVCGHNWTPYLGFKGGKGVSTTLGAVMGLGFSFPKLLILFLVAVAGWAIVFFLSIVVSLASIASAFCFFIFSFILNVDLEFKFMAFLLFIFVLIRHKKNIQNILQKKESHF